MSPTGVQNINKEKWLTEYFEKIGADQQDQNYIQKKNFQFASNDPLKNVLLCNIVFDF